jgi:hypothetical protein
MKEAKIEEHLRKRVKELGGTHRKVTYQGRGGALDDWCFFPGGRLLIVECKRPKKNSLDPLQEVELAWLQRMGFKADWVNTKEGVDQILKDFLESF